MCFDRCNPKRYPKPRKRTRNIQKEKNKNPLTVEQNPRKALEKHQKTLRKPPKNANNLPLSLAFDPPPPPQPARGGLLSSSAAWGADLINGEALFDGNCVSCHAGGGNKTLGGVVDGWLLGWLVWGWLMVMGSRSIEVEV